MDQPPSVAEKALKRITTQLECSVCLDTYTDAKLLPCFHSFCKKCLKRLVVQDHDGHTLTCPNCRRTTPLPPAGVSGLQTDFHVEHLFEIRDMLSKAKEPQKTQCEKCEESLATGFCRNCGQFVCNKCTEIHKTIYTALIWHLSKIPSPCSKFYCCYTPCALYCPKLAVIWDYLSTGASITP